MPGAFRSTLIPPTGPAVEQFPTRSHTERVPVFASAVSLPAATSVASVNEASAAVSPAPPSVAEQVIRAFSACHPGGGASQSMPGAFRSTLIPPTGPAVEQFPTRSHTERVPVFASAVSTSRATFVDRVNEGSDLRPDPWSRAVHVAVTSRSEEHTSELQSR